MPVWNKADYIPFDRFSAPHGREEFERLGHGSFGRVIGGELCGTPVALKEVLPTSEYDFDKYFERELEMLRCLGHPNIVQYMGLTRSPPPVPHVYMVTERVPGGTLAEHIVDKPNPFPWRLRLTLSTDIARALSFIHAHRCLHRDIKGDNVLITTRDRGKLCDFGFARVVANNASEMARISFLGTSAYMAPELLLGREYSYPADTFSFGVILCEVACRSLATDFPRSNRYRSIDPDHVRRHASHDCPPELLDLALRCTRASPGERPSMQYVVDRLAHIEAQFVQQELALWALRSDTARQYFYLPNLDRATLQMHFEKRDKLRHEQCWKSLVLNDESSSLSSDDLDESDIGVPRQATSLPSDRM